MITAYIIIGVLFPISLLLLPSNASKFKRSPYKSLIVLALLGLFWPLVFISLVGAVIYKLIWRD